MEDYIGQSTSLVHDYNLQNQIMLLIYSIAQRVQIFMYRTVFFPDSFTYGRVLI